MGQPGFFDVGQLYNSGLVNGQLVWTQPGGEGTQVFPALPTVYPPIPQGYPQQVFVYQGLYVFGCRHWANTLETFQVYDPYTQLQALLLCCPMCSYIQQIVEPAALWWDDYYGLYPTGLGTGVYR